MEIPLEQAMGGDVLDGDVVGPDGVVMLAAGAKLTSHSIDLLRGRGVTWVAVSRGRPLEVVGSEQVDAAIGALERMFSDVAGDPIMKAIYEVARSMLDRVRTEK